MTFICQDFWVSFLANLSADFIIGIILYFILTNLPEKRKEKEILIKGLTNFREEIKVNQEKRIPRLIEDLKKLPGGVIENSQLMLAQNAWESLKVTGLLPRIKNVNLVHNIFQLEEQINETNHLLHEVEELVFFHPKLLRKENVIPECKIRSCELVTRYLKRTLELLDAEINGQS
jgi:hypothetical protein